MGSLDQIKGYTRSSVIMTVLLAASELDVNSDESWDMLKPLMGFLDKAWLIPVVASWRQGVLGLRLSRLFVPNGSSLQTFKLRCP